MKIPSSTELCGKPAMGGPCTMKKDHYAPYHRHRVYQKVEWTISDTMGKVLEKGNARVPMNYAITRQFEKSKNLVIHLTQYDSPDGSDNEK